MQFDSLIKRDLIFLDLPLSSKEEALRYLANILVQKGYAKDTFPEAIIEREKSNPTGLPMTGHKIAIPHTTSDHVLESALIFARLKDNVVFEEMGGDPGSTVSVRLISMFALKEKKLIGDLLEALITAYQDEAMLEDIIRASESDKVYDILLQKVSQRTRADDDKGVTLEGTPVSPGMRRGRAYLYRIPEVKVLERAVGSADDELHRLKAAMRKAIEELEIIRKNIAGKMGEEFGHIFSSHQTMIEDEDFIGEIQVKIIDEGKSCEKALQETFEQYKTMFGELEDGDYNKERLTDLADVYGRLLRNMLGIPEVNLANVPADSIVIADELLPSDTALMTREKVNGIITERGGVTSHVAILAKNMRIPAIVGVKSVLQKFKEDDEIYIDCRDFEKGRIYRNPDDATRVELNGHIAAWERRAHELLAAKDREPVTIDGKRIQVSANIGSRSDFRQALEYGVRSIGLLRTEFMFLSPDADSYSEESQFDFYRELAEKLKPEMVLIRTLDVGGDKDFNLFNIGKEENPFLGVRGIRPCLEHPEIFKHQIRALLRASAFGNVKVMFPMITDVCEIRKIQELFDTCRGELRGEGKTFGENIEIGIMVETPAAVIMSDVLTRYTDFISIGTNDLTQYVLAADRTNERVAQYYKQFHPGVFRAIKASADAAHKNGKWVGVCGELGGVQLAIPLLIGLGVDELSMAPQLQPEAIELIRNISYDGCRKMADQALALEDDESVRKLLKSWR